MFSRTRIVFAPAALACVVLAACGGRGADVTHFPGCELPPPVLDPQAALVAPAKGATGVPASIGTITFAVSDPALRQGETVTLFPAIGPSITTTQITTGNGALSATIPALQSATVYNVSVSAPLPPERQTLCVKSILGLLGSFTTQ